MTLQPPAPSREEWPWPDQDADLAAELEAVLPMWEAGLVGPGDPEDEEFAWLYDSANAEAGALSKAPISSRPRQSRIRWNRTG
jgi:hypothetical protein